MKLPEELKNKLEEVSSKYKESELKKAYSGISERYTTEERTGSTLLEKEIDVIAYANARMPATYSAVYSAFEKAYKYIDENKIKTLIDVGAGTGAATWAISSFIDFEKITCIEREASMIDLAKALMKDTSLAIANWEKQDITDAKLQEKADIIVASYMLNEIREDKKIEIIEKLWNNTNEILFIIEPGTPENYKNIMKYKDYLVQNGGCIVAPCAHQNKCELPENDWCHFICRVERTKIHKNIKDADSPFEDEKFIYLVASKRKIEGAKNRILRHPRIEKGYVEVKLCTEEGIKEEKITKSQKERYKAARKAIAGDEM